MAIPDMMASEDQETARGSPPAGFLLAPILTAGVLSFAALGLLSSGLQHGFDRTTVALLISPALGVIASPGYACALLTWRKWSQLGAIANAWIKLSCVLVILASGGAAIASIPTGIGPILSVWTLLMATKLLVLFHRGTRGRNRKRQEGQEGHEHASG